MGLPAIVCSPSTSISDGCSRIFDCKNWDKLATLKLNRKTSADLHQILKFGGKTTKKQVEETTVTVLPVRNCPEFQVVVRSLIGTTITDAPTPTSLYEQCEAGILPPSIGVEVGGIATDNASSLVLLQWSSSAPFSSTPSSSSSSFNPSLLRRRRTLSEES